jgi:hypothetical protein
VRWASSADRGGRVSGRCVGAVVVEEVEEEDEEEEEEQR